MMTKQKTIFSGVARSNSEKLSTARAAGKLPANLFGLKQDSQAILLDNKIFSKHLNQEGDAGLIYVEVEGAEIPVLIDEVQKNPLTSALLHVALKRVNLKEKIVSAVPVEMINVQEIKEATIILTTQEVEVEAYPADLPEAIIVDASTLTEVGQEVGWDDITSFDRSKVKLMLSEEELVQPVALVQEVKEEVVEEVPAEGEAVEGETPTAGTETPAEGGTAPTEESAE